MSDKFSQHLADFAESIGIEIEDPKVTWPLLSEVSPWISVEDRLPSSTGAYWTFNGLDEKPSSIQQRVHMYNAKHKIFNSYTVTHWMPLPAPPVTK